MLVCCSLAIKAGAGHCVDTMRADQVRFYWLQIACTLTIAMSTHDNFDIMPSIYITRMLVVAIVHCSALAGKAFAVSLRNAPLLSIPNPLILLVKDIAGPPPSQKLGRYLNVHSPALSSVWYEGEETFNITMDMCVSMDAIVGIYQFTNGTSKNDATIYDISEDMKQIIGSPLYSQNFGSHAIANAQLAVNDINAFIDNDVSCDNVTVSSIDHNELRRLLADPPDGYWATLILQGLAASISTGIGLALGKWAEWSVSAPLIPSLAFLAYMLNGWLARLQKTGKMSYLGALLGNIFSCCIRREVEQAAAIGLIDACKFATNPIYRDSISSLPSYGNAMVIFELEQGAEGLPCSS